MLFQRRFVVREGRGRGDSGAELLDLFLGCHQLALVLTLLSSYSFLKHLNYSSSFLLCLLACCFCSSHISSSFDDVFIGHGGCFKPRPRRAAARGRRLQSWCGARPRGRREKKKKGARGVGWGCLLNLTWETWCRCWWMMLSFSSFFSSFFSFALELCVFIPAAPRPRRRRPPRPCPTSKASGCRAAAA